jgi:hypothetical protein
MFRIVFLQLPEKIELEVVACSLKDLEKEMERITQSPDLQLICVSRINGV